MTLAVTHTTLADTTFSVAGAAAWNAGHSVAGGTAGSILYVGGTGALAEDNANLKFSTASGPRVQIGSTGTSAGLVLGYYGSSGFGAIWASTLTPTTSNYSLFVSSTETYLQAPNGLVNINAGSRTVGTFWNTLGRGLELKAGAAASDVQALSVTQTWNNAAISFTGNKFSVTDTASAAGSLHSAWFGGAAAATPLMSLGKTGVLTLGDGAATGSVKLSKTAIGSGGATLGEQTTAATVKKTITAIADNTATPTFTVTVPNAAHSASIKLTLKGSLGAGGAIGANEATGSISYDIAIARTAGVATVVGVSTAYGSSTAAVAGGATITITAAASGLTGANSASQTFTIDVTIARGSGASANHTCGCFATIINANASGVTLS